MPPRTERLTFTPLSIAALEALLASDRGRLQAVAGAIFPDPLAAPPEMADALPVMRDALRDDPASAAWGPFLMVLRETGQAAGSAGFFARPDAAGTLILGDSVYPSHQRRGLASEAAAALVDWALAQPGIAQVQATIPPRHIAS